MIKFSEFLLEKKFPNWRLHQKSEREIEMFPLISERKDEIPEILGFLSTRLAESEWSVSVGKDKLVATLKRQSKYHRMYTSGCFDIFHYGHLNILLRSKELCDYLIVGVSTDELIEKEKGKRPIIPFEERIKVVKSIGLVDEVIAQTNKNKQQIVDDYQIDAISVGSDWKGRYPKVTCAMEYFPYTENVSSTILREALKLNQ